MCVKNMAAAVGGRGAKNNEGNVVSLNNHGISWQPFRITIGFDIMSSIPSEGPLNSNIYVLNG